jgi:hypothetical protein
VDQLHRRRRLVDLLPPGAGALEEILNQIRIEEFLARGKVGERPRRGGEGAEGVVGDAWGEEGAREERHEDGNGVKAGDDGVCASRYHGRLLRKLTVSASAWRRMSLVF